MITIVTAAHKRPKRFEIALRNWTRLFPAPKIFVMLSPDDGENEKLCIKYGADFEYHKNNPLGAKWNAAMIGASKNKTDHYLIMGSDDLISQGLWNSYISFDGDYLGLTDFYFYNLSERRCIHWHGFHRTNKRHIGEPIGAGRLLSHSILEKIDFRPFKDELDRALDYEVHTRIMAAGAICVAKTCAELGGMAIDLKTSTLEIKDQPNARDGGNLNKFRLYENSEYIKREVIQTNFPDIWGLINDFYEL